MYNTRYQMRTKYHNESKNIYKKENIKVKKVTFNEEKENIIEILMKRVKELENIGDES